MTNNFYANRCVLISRGGSVLYFYVLVLPLNIVFVSCSLVSHCFTAYSVQHSFVEELLYDCCWLIDWFFYISCSTSRCGCRISSATRQVMLLRLWIVWHWGPQLYDSHHWLMCRWFPFVMRSMVWLRRKNAQIASFLWSAAQNPERLHWLSEMEKKNSSRLFRWRSWIC